MKRFLIALLLVAALAASARSYVTDTYGGNPVRWPNAVATVNHDPVTITGAYITELKAALAVWSNVSGSAFRFIHGGASQAANVKDSNNGSTDVYFDASLPPYGYAVTMVNQPYTSADITERDVAFNASGAVTWKTSASGSGVDFRTVAIHELGHVLGLLHESSKTSVMNVTGWDPANARHSLEADDMDAVRYLYPGTTPGPGPGPGPGPTLFADVTIDSVTAEPEDAAPGEQITIGYTVRNNGAAASGSFTTGAYLTGGLVPTTSDRLLGSRPDADLAIGASRDASIKVQVPTGLPPGKYRYGVLADIHGDVVERFQTNNGNATLPLLIIERPAVEVGPGQIITAELGPQGEDRFRIHLPERANLKLWAKQEPGSVALTMIRVGDEPKLLNTGLTKAVKEKIRILSPGEYELALRSSSANTSEYELKIKVKLKTLRRREAVDTELRIPFRAWSGCEVKAVVRGRKGFVPTAEIEGMEVPVLARKRKVRLGPWTVPENDLYELVIRPGEGMTEPGEVSLTIRIKPPAEWIVLTR